MTTQTLEKPADARHTDPRQERFFAPDVDIVQDERGFSIRALIPGADPSGLDVRFDQGVLTLTATVPSRQDPDTRYLLREYRTGNYRRSFRVDDRIDADAITASYQKGTLLVRLPLQKAEQPRQIQVSLD